MEDSGPAGYNAAVEGFRDEEYPMLSGCVYLDHAGTTLYSKSLMDRFTSDMMSNLLGNPHSGSYPSQNTTSRIEDIRLRLLRFFGADPTDFDLVFVANATAGVKLVIDALRRDGFSYAYHQACHTSLVGAREEAKRSVCVDDNQMREWVRSGRVPVEESDTSESSQSDDVLLFSYPAQSHMDGKRYPLSWASDVREARQQSAYDNEPDRGERRSPQKVYTLLDAASLVATSTLCLADPEAAPDFTVLSLYKIFGFPDLGALIVRRQAAPAFNGRRYFGGGTVDVVSCIKEQWHFPKTRFLHEKLEDGTLPFHNILALDAALDSHKALYGSMAHVSSHTSFLASRLRDGLTRLRHENGQPVCTIYTPLPDDEHNHHDSFNLGNGPVISFNLRTAAGAWVSPAEFEKLSTVKNFRLRTGGVCSPGGIAAALDLQPWELRRNFSAGFKCGSDLNDLLSGKPTGVIRASLGAMSTISDVDNFISFIDEFYLENEVISPVLPTGMGASFPTTSESTTTPSDGEMDLRVQSLTVYPIKSCGGYSIPPGVQWEIKPEGLAWDREWCLVHQGTGQALSQKRHPRMAFIRPSLDFASGLLRISYHGPRPGDDFSREQESDGKNKSSEGKDDEISVPLYGSAEPAPTVPSRVCGEDIAAEPYTNPYINDFFTSVLGVPCLLARFPAGGKGLSMRHSKAKIQWHQKKPGSPLSPEAPPSLSQPKHLAPQPPPQSQSPQTLELERMPGSFPTHHEREPLPPPSPPDSDPESHEKKSRILLSNESPILLVNERSLDSLNSDIRDGGAVPVPISSFRGNVVVGPGRTGGTSGAPEKDLAYVEDTWARLRIGTQQFITMGSCRRCQMVSIDQLSGERRQEPFTTLAKTRRFGGKIYFGVHMRHDAAPLGDPSNAEYPTICVGDAVQVVESH